MVITSHPLATRAGIDALRDGGHARHGTRSKAHIMKPAIDLAHGGFEIQPFLFGDMYASLETIGRSAGGREMYMPGGALLRPGDLLVQHRAGETLERLVAGGNEHF